MSESAEQLGGGVNAGLGVGAQLALIARQNEEQIRQGEHQSAKIEEIKTILSGPTTRPSEGLIVRVDNIEKEMLSERELRNKNSDRQYGWIILALGAAATALAEAVARFFRGH